MRRGESGFTCPHNSIATFWPKLLKLLVRLFFFLIVKPINWKQKSGNQKSGCSEENKPYMGSACYHGATLVGVVCSVGVSFSCTFWDLQVFPILQWTVWWGAVFCKIHLVCSHPWTINWHLRRFKRKITRISSNTTQNMEGIRCSHIFHKMILSRSQQTADKQDFRGRFHDRGATPSFATRGRSLTNKIPQLLREEKLVENKKIFFWIMSFAYLTVTFE